MILSSTRTTTKTYLGCVNCYLTNLLIAVRMHPGPMRTLNYVLSLLEFESMLDELMLAMQAVVQVLVMQVVMPVAQFLK